MVFEVINTGILLGVGFLFIKHQRSIARDIKAAAIQIRSASDGLDARIQAKVDEKVEHAANNIRQSIVATITLLFEKQREKA
jgi:hypothetical protein